MNPNWRLIRLLIFAWFVVMAFTVMLRIKMFVMLLPLIMFVLILYILFCFITVALSKNPKKKEDEE